MNARTTTIIGVMPPSFEFPRDQIWSPIFNEFQYRQRPGGSFHVLRRIKRDVSFDQAEAEFGGHLQRLAREYPQTNERFTVPRLQPLLDNFIARRTRHLLMAMLGAVLAVLLIACVNVMNMQFGRGTVRASE